MHEYQLAIAYTADPDKKRHRRITMSGSFAYCRKISQQSLLQNSQPRSLPIQISRIVIWDEGRSNISNIISMRLLWPDFSHAAQIAPLLPWPTSGWDARWKTEEICKQRFVRMKRR